MIAVTQKGAASGVAELDNTGRLPASQLPTTLATNSYYVTIASPSNTTTTLRRIFKEKIQINAIYHATTAGTIKVQIGVNGAGFGTVYDVSSTAGEVNLSTPIQVDATSTSKTVQIITTNASTSPAAANLEVVLAVSVVSS